MVGRGEVDDSGNDDEEGDKRRNKSKKIRTEEE